MEEEAQVAGGRHWHDEAQQPGWVKHVPVPRGDEREAAEHFGVPERQMPEPLVPLGAPRMERNTRDVLVAPGAREPEAAQHRQRQEDGPRSEEHTFELQSPYDLVCRLLLEKKNKADGEDRY